MWKSKKLAFFYFYFHYYLYFCSQADTKRKGNKTQVVLLFSSFHSLFHSLLQVICMYEKFFPQYPEEEYSWNDERYTAWEILARWVFVKLVHDDLD